MDRAELKMMLADTIPAAVAFIERHMASGVEIGLSSRATRNRLARLVERNLVVEIGSGPTDPKRRYHKARQ